jgi:hypothetical protein|tara:strand:+ start:740 stop:1012 length:273 start_codon:yes stop_codon:yes gene_type:complete
MFILTLAGKTQEGAYSVADENGENVLYIFEEEDDADRFVMMLEEKEYPELDVVEVDDELIISTCEMHSYNYAIITKNDLVIPPEEDNDSV